MSNTGILPMSRRAILALPPPAKRPYHFSYTLQEHTRHPIL